MAVTKKTTSIKASSDKKPASVKASKDKQTTSKKVARLSTKKVSATKTEVNTKAEGEKTSVESLVNKPVKKEEKSKTVPKRGLTRNGNGPSLIPPERKESRGSVEFVNGRKVWRSANTTSVGFDGAVDGRIIPDAGVPTEEIVGFLDMMRDGNGIVRSTFRGGDRDAYISGTQIRRFRIRPGDEVTGPARKPKENEQYWGLLKVEKLNGKTPEEMVKRPIFEKLTPVYPDKKLVLETEKGELSTRLIDLVAPVGRGQRGMIVSPPKAGKTTILKNVAKGVAKNYKDVHLMAVLIGERPEEVTDITRHIAAVTGGKGEVAASNFDEQATEQVRVSELALERAKRMVELGAHVVIITDSITRMARAYNLAIPTSGRTLSGGFDPAALYPPKRFFGAARNFEDFETVGGKKTGSLTILGTALVDTGSKMDDLIYEEFKGTGNMELHLDRELAERRVWPAIDVQRSGTRREDLLFSQSEYQGVVLMRRMLDMLDPKERTAVMSNKMKNTKNNKEFLATLKEG